MGIDTQLSATALAIALVALLIAVGQLLQQYFATADGYRRCQKSVMRGWARKTRLRWRWREFRFETLFSVPEIYFAGDGAPHRLGGFTIDGSDASRSATLIPARDFAWHHPADRPAFTDELACWLPFLNRVHDMAAATTPTKQEAVAMQASSRNPGLIARERSWDFQPPDVIRPLATSTVADIAVLARRMGMRWKDFRPADGIMRAEGHSHIITSTIVRSLGIVLQYSNTAQGKMMQEAEANMGRAAAGSINQEQPEIYIPRGSADRLGCGVIRGERRLSMPDFTLGTQPEIAAALRVLETTGFAAQLFKEMRVRRPDFELPVADIVAMSMAFIRQPGSTLVQVPAPSDNVTGFSVHRAGRRAFRLFLDDFATTPRAGPKTRDILAALQRLSADHPEWDAAPDAANTPEPWVVRQPLAFLDAAHVLGKDLTAYLQQLEDHRPPGSSFAYPRLLAAHIRFGVFHTSVPADGSFSDVARRGAAASGAPMGPAASGAAAAGRDPDRFLDQLVRQMTSLDYAATMRHYFRLWEDIEGYTNTWGAPAREFGYVDGWVAMMARACCWGACHFFVPGERVPIEYFGSQQPVYLG